MGNLKGSGWLGALALIKEKAGTEGLERVKAKLSEDDRALIFGKPILPVSWLDYGAYIRCMLVADQVIGTGSKALLAEAAHFAAEKNLKGLYRFLIAISSPQGAIAKAPLIWRQYHDVGTITIVATGKGFVDVKLTDWPDIPLYHDISHGAFMETAVEIAGGRNVRHTHPTCIARGDQFCLFKFTWDE